jgi:rubredoxin
MLRPMRKYRCTVCSHVYDPAEGDPASAIAPGTPFELLPDDWSCPECGATKADFEPMD